MASGLVGVSLLALVNSTGCSSGKTEGGSVVGDLGSGTGAVGATTNMPPPSTAGMRSGSGGSSPIELGNTGGNVVDDGSTGGTGVGGGCAATFVQAKVKTLAMFIMLDQSLSMDQVVDMTTQTSRWDAVTTAFASFVKNPATADIPVGLQYFGLAPTSGAGGAGGAGTGGASGGSGGAASGGAAGRGNGGGVAVGGFGNPGGPINPGGPGGGIGGPFGGNNVSCSVADYAKAEVAIAPLAGNAQAIIDSMAAHAPSTTTPTLPAIQGGIQFVSQYAADHPDNKVVLVLATDGEPSGCNSDLQNVTAAAAAGLSGTPSVETYVIGVGSNLDNLNAIAVAGGTKQAFLVSDANVQQDLLTALTTIQGAVVPCQYSVPVPMMGKALDFGKVNVQYTPNVGTPQPFQNVASKAACPSTGNFWYYDDNAAPKEIFLCENTCESLTNVTAGKVEIILDCKETLKPPT